MSESPQFFKPELFQEAFVIREGFHRANWERVGSWIYENVAPKQVEAAWVEAARFWVQLLREDLGGSYRVSESEQTIILCAEPDETARWLIDFGRRADQMIKRYLGDTAWKGAIGKNVFLVFSEQQTYYDYTSFHCGDEEEQAGSGGMCIYSGYTHIALPWVTQLDAANVIIHELAHASVAHLALPRWLNEGIAVTLDNAVTSHREWSLVAEEFERHFAFWNEENIQGFWAGQSFLEPGDSNELSYHLAFILLKLLSERVTPEKFKSFVETAHWKDGGQKAAMDALGVDLGELTGTFLGPGKWQPDLKTMELYWS